MSDFDELDPETRSFALVGQFLQAWSVMEASLHAAIGAALAIEDTKLDILCANIRFRDKVHILATLVDIQPYFAAPDKEQFRKDLREIADYAGTRNMMAHDPFHADASGKGVEFLMVKAKGKFDLPNVVWSAEKFQTEGRLIDQYKKFLEGLATAFSRQPMNYADALRRFLEQGQDKSWPMQRTMSLVLQDYLSRQVPTPPDSNPHPSNDGTTAQTPPKPEE